MLYCQSVELKKGVGVVLHIDQYEQDAQNKVRLEFGDSPMNIDRIETVILAGQKECTATCV